MPYPNEIYDQLIQKYSLSDELKELLLDTLKVVGMQEIIENKWLSPDNLLKQHNTNPAKYSILPPIKAQMLVRTYLAIKDIDQIKFREIAFSNMLLWLENNNEPYAYVLSANLAKNSITDKNIIPELFKAAREYPTEMNEWDNIKIIIQKINTLHFRSPDRRTLIDEAMRELPKLAPFIGKFIPLNIEYLDFSVVLFDQFNKRTEPLEEAAKTYFEALLKGQNKKIIGTNFYSKQGGDQLGKRMQIEYENLDSGNKHQIIYYVKTHQHGSNSRSSSTKQVDPKELFIYKVFEYIGMGPKIHFFFNLLSRGGFFIATQDAAFTKKTDYTKFFHTYEKMQTNNLLHPNEETYMNLSCLDIISRIFHLRDVTTNSGNFGCVLLGNGIQKRWLILDFIIDTFDSYIYDNIFEGFRNGNGRYNYNGFLKNTFKDRTENERMKTATKVIQILEEGRPSNLQLNKKKLSLIASIEKAYTEIVAYVKENHIALSLDINSVLADLGNYKKAVEENYKVLASGIKAAVTSSAQPSSATVAPPPGM